jgi:hypothetical protein
MFFALHRCIKLGNESPLPPKQTTIFNLTNMYNCIIHVHNSLSPNFPSQTLHFISELFTILATRFSLHDYNPPYVSATYLTSLTAIILTSGVFIVIQISFYHSQ